MNAFSHNLGQVTYPRMERQDLTQGQLGSFKFTPTDEVRPVFSGIPSRMVQQFTYPFDCSAHIDQPSSRSTATRSAQCIAPESPNSVHPPAQVDFTFFDNFIKPDLAKSRLNLGPAAVRAAVDGAPLSPRRQALENKVFQPVCVPSTIQPTMQAQNDNLAWDASVQTADHPFAPTPDTCPATITILYTSLVRALASEQQAHQTTKDALDLERNGRIKAEAECQKYLDHNRSLIASVNMLKSVIQHNVKREQEAAQQASVDKYYKEADAAGPSQTILHDAIKNLRRPQPPRDEVKAGSKFTQQRPVDSNALFNFDLLNTHGSPALRRHFSIPTTDSVSQYAPSQNPSSAKNSRRGESSEAWQTGEDTSSTTPVETTTAKELVVLKGNSDSVPKLMAMPFDAHVQWNRDPIFDDDEDKIHRLGYQASNFAQHPVRYKPKKSDKNIYRTVMIDFIPQGATSKEILDVIRGGAVESIQTYGPIGHSTTFRTARVVFTYELGAQGVYMRGQDPGITIHGKRVRVWQILEATYPRSKELEKEIFDEGFSRFLLIDNAVQASLDKLPQKLARQIQSGHIIEICKAFDGLPMIEFTSVAECSKALKQLMNDPDFGGSRFDFEEDPCSHPY